jgi:hypothetical protein
VICDGLKVNDKESPYFGKAVPNLIDKFVMGVTVNRLSETGGRATLDPIPEYKATIPTGNAFAQSDGYSVDCRRDKTPQANGLNHTHVVPIDIPGHDFGDTRPPYYGLVKLIRIR